MATVDPDSSRERLGDLGRVPFDEALEALEQPGGRAILFSLLDRSARNADQVPLQEFTTDPAPESEPPADGARSHEPDLSDLAERRFVDWDPDTRRVERGPAYGEVRPLLETLRDHESELPEDWL